MTAAMVLALPLYRTFQMNKVDSRKYNFSLHYFVVLDVWQGLSFAKYR